jgi:hypothetical protein
MKTLRNVTLSLLVGAPVALTGMAAIAGIMQIPVLKDVLGVLSFLTVFFLVGALVCLKAGWWK